MEFALYNQINNAQYVYLTEYSFEDEDCQEDKNKLIFVLPVTIVHLKIKHIGDVLQPDQCPEQHINGQVTTMWPLKDVNECKNLPSMVQHTSKMCCQPPC